MNALTLKDAADLATTLTLIVATVTFVLAVLEHKQREREKLKVARQRQIQDWQQVVVYRIIEQGDTYFETIKLQYLAQAQQLSSFDLPVEEIQDDALQLALMTLIKDRLVSKTTEGGFAINAISLEENAMRNFAMAQLQQRRGQNALISRFHETLETDSGKYTIDQLYRVFKAEELGYKFEDFDILVRDQIRASGGAIVITVPSQKLWLRAKLPQPKPPAQQNSPNNVSNPPAASGS